uniref:Uncharacterized protein n=1 Tax=Arundo donax TaxID=35708 RepID=A0A0A9EGZ6_ARUDO
MAVPIRNHESSFTALSPTRRQTPVQSLHLSQNRSHAQTNCSTNTDKLHKY